MAGAAALRRLVLRAGRRAPRPLAELAVPGLFGLTAAQTSAFHQAAFGYRVGMSEILSRITVESGKCGGRPCIRGFRLRVKDVLELLAHGASWDEILKD